MYLLDRTLPTLADNLALDEALLLEAEDGRAGEGLRFWEWSRYAVVLGAGGKLQEDVDLARCETDGVPILRRASGGGTVLLGPGCLCYSLVLGYARDPMLRDVNASYRYILLRMVEALHPLLPALSASGTSDLAAAGLKFSGNAQQRKKTYLLHHGTLLYDFDRVRVARYLRMPVRQPEYRAGRPHPEFLINLPTTVADLRHRVQTAWDTVTERTQWPVERVRLLVEEKYGRDEWVRRR